MRIFATKTYQFDHPTGAEDGVVVQHQSFADVPEWVTKSLIFKLAQKDGSVEVLESKQDEAAAEKGAKAAVKAEAKRLEAEAKAKEEQEAREREEAEAKAKQQATAE
ncbi:hypothetical protein WMW72_12205 [Paenibacillus filicis]|uniref:Uncharacterized protein n=1 Tax=Paenibacillus filicis TaxID=669464 RepID=A0ABU9DKQ3_9BACL